MASDINNPLNCPDAATLGEFATGNLAPRAFRRVARHVAGCPACEEALAQFDTPTDPLLTQLRAADGAPDESVSVDLLTAARSCYRDRPTPATPRRIGKFELLEELGVGSFGTVFRARDTELGRTVAIKMLRAGSLASREEIDRFMREARSAAQLHHPGLVALHETGLTEDGLVYLVEEFVPGETLTARMRSGPVNFRWAAEMIASIADALEHAHAQGVIHRDVKPSNIQIDTDGRPHLMDFGLAKLDADESSMTLDGQMLGTPAYVSPEQARGETHVDGRTDVYSLGVVLYELMTGERPFRGSRPMLLLQVLHDEPRPLRQLNHKVPRDLETICLKAMAKTPARRYTTAKELADDLRRFLNGEQIRARPRGRVAKLLRWCARNPVAVGLLLAVSLSSAFGLWELSNLNEYLVRSSALESAAQQAEILEEMNNLYSSDVVDRAAEKKVTATHDYHKFSGAIPLPASFTIRVGRQISQRSETGMQVRLYSEFPFRTRTDGSAQDAFEREALEHLKQDSSKPFYRFEDFNGRPALRYAKGQRMQATCVACHNGHKDKYPGKVWKQDELAGVLEIIRPLDRDAQRSRDGLRLTLISMAVISGSMLGLSFLVLLVGPRRRTLPGADAPGY